MLEVTGSKIIQHNEATSTLTIEATINHRSKCVLMAQADESGKYQVKTIQKNESLLCPVCHRDGSCTCLDSYKEVLLVQTIEKTPELRLDFVTSGKI